MHITCSISIILLIIFMGQKSRIWLNACSCLVLFSVIHLAILIWHSGWQGLLFLRYKFYKLSSQFSDSHLFLSHPQRGSVRVCVLEWSYLFWCSPVNIFEYTCLISFKMRLLGHSIAPTNAAMVDLMRFSWPRLILLLSLITASGTQMKYINTLCVFYKLVSSFYKIYGLNKQICFC